MPAGPARGWATVSEAQHFAKLELTSGWTRIINPGGLLPDLVADRLGWVPTCPVNAQVNACSPRGKRVECPLGRLRSESMIGANYLTSSLERVLANETILIIYGAQRLDDICP